MSSGRSGLLFAAALVQSARLTEEQRVAAGGASLCARDPGLGEPVIVIAKR